MDNLEKVMDKEKAEQVRKYSIQLLNGEITIGRYNDEILQMALNFERSNMPRLSLIELSKIYFETRARYFQGRITRNLEGGQYGG